MSASTSSAVLVAPAPKKRKRDQADDPRGTIVKKVTTGLQQQAAVPSKSWASGSGPATADVRNFLLAISLVANCALIHHQPSNDVVPCDDKEGHYIIVPDDIIYNRCKASSAGNTPSVANSRCFQIARFAFLAKGPSAR